MPLRHVVREECGGLFPRANCAFCRRAAGARRPKMRLQQSSNDALTCGRRRSPRRATIAPRGGCTMARLGCESLRFWIVPAFLWLTLAGCGGISRTVPNAVAAPPAAQILHSVSTNGKKLVDLAVKFRHCPGNTSVDPGANPLPCLSPATRTIVVNVAGSLSQQSL